MSDPLQQLFRPQSLEANLFPPTSRYHGMATATLTLASGESVVYLRRRFVPPPEELALLQAHDVAQGDRLDNLAARYLGDAELFWRLADANRALHPDELTRVIGRRLRIALPQGIPGVGGG